MAVLVMLVLNFLPWNSGFTFMLFCVVGFEAKVRQRIKLRSEYSFFAFTVRYHSAIGQQKFALLTRMNRPQFHNNLVAGKSKTRPTFILEGINVYLTSLGTGNAVSEPLY